MSEDQNKNFSKDKTADKVTRDSPEDEESNTEDNGQIQNDTVETLSNPVEDRKSEEKLDADSLQNASLSPVSISSPLEGAVGYTRRRASSESTIDDLNRAARNLDNLMLPRGKLTIFQKFFLAPRMIFFTKPEGRKRHKAGNQVQPSESANEQETLRNSEAFPRDPLADLRTFDIPRRPTVNQAGAVIGYPERMPTAEEIQGNKNDIVICDRPYDSDHSLGSAETVPIHEVYIGNLTPVSHRSASAGGISSADRSNFKVSSYESSSVPSDSLPGVYRISPPSEDMDSQAECPKRRRKLGVSKPVDIPGRRVIHTGNSYPENFHKPASREALSELEPLLSVYVRNKLKGTRRKTSKDSSTDTSDKDQSTSLDSSVDLDMYMSVKCTEDESSARRHLGSPSGRLSPLPKPDLFIDPSVEQSIPITDLLTDSSGGDQSHIVPECLTNQSGAVDDLCVESSEINLSEISDVHDNHSASNVELSSDYPPQTPDDPEQNSSFPNQDKS